jgi:hypothetical protein
VGAVIVPGNLPLPAGPIAALALQHRLATRGAENLQAQGGLMANAVSPGLTESPCSAARMRLAAPEMLMGS